MIITILSLDGVQLYRGDHVDLRAAVAHCAQAGISLANADLRGAVLDGADLSGVNLSSADLRGASMRNVTAAGPRMAEFSACIFDATTEISGSMLANFACSGPPGVFRVELADGSNLRGCNWDACPDVIRLPVRDDRVGQVYALRNGTGWKVCAGARGVRSEAAAKAALTALPDVGARYAAAFAYLESPEGVQRKAAIDARPAAALVESEAKAR